MRLDQTLYLVEFFRSHSNPEPAWWSISKHSIHAGPINLESCQAQQPSTDHCHGLRVRLGSVLGAKIKTSVNIHLSRCDHPSTNQFRARSIRKERSIIRQKKRRSLSGKPLYLPQLFGKKRRSSLSGKPLPAEYFVGK